MYVCTHYFKKCSTFICMVRLPGLQHMLFSSDFKYINTSADASSLIAPSDKPMISKRIVFLRHAESEWNEIFNRGLNLSFPGRLWNAIVREVLTPVGSKYLYNERNDICIKQVYILSKKLN